eukprot:GHVH01007404.1.p1 GENE.GHVH01007404.1~~GHVH01007404.1.p1  ORF type:complete len:164 (+),score=21.14 GHVH01007404.1:476-967(+)
MSQSEWLEAKRCLNESKKLFAPRDELREGAPAGRHFKVANLKNDVLHQSQSVSDVMEGFFPVAWSNMEFPNATEMVFRVDTESQAEDLELYNRIIYHQDDDEEQDAVSAILSRYLRGARVETNAGGEFSEAREALASASCRRQRVGVSSLRVARCDMETHNKI